VAGLGANCIGCRITSYRESSSGISFKLTGDATLFGRRFLEGLASLGYVEGAKILRIELREADGPLRATA